MLDELRLAHEHLVFKWTSLDPDIKCSQVVASINIKKVTPEIITTITELLRTIMSIYGLECSMEVSGAAGCNWVAFRDMMSTHTLSRILLKDLMSQHPDIDFDVKIVDLDDVTNENFISIPDMPDSIG